MKRILITGASGMLGSHLVQYFQEKYDVFASSTIDYNNNSATNFIPFDLQSNSYKSLINECNPQLIIHCAAITNGNFCENNPEDALYINGLSVKKLIDATNENVRIIYISTDAVYSPNVTRATEKDVIDPSGVYGKSKELGEFFLKQSNRLGSHIIRTTIVGLNNNPSKKGFLEWIIESSRRSEEISLFGDVFFTPISIWSLRYEIERIIESTKHNFPLILNVAGIEFCSKYEFGIKLLKRLGLKTKNIKEGKIADFKMRAGRSNDQTMSSQLYQDLIGESLPNIDETIQEICDNINLMPYE